MSTAELSGWLSKCRAKPSYGEASRALKEPVESTQNSWMFANRLPRVGGPDYRCEKQVQPFRWTERNFILVDESLV